MAVKKAMYALGRLKSGVMNKTEGVYAQRLEMLKRAGEMLGMPLDRYDNPMFDHDEIQGEIKIAQLQYNLTPNTLIIKIIK